MLYTSAQAAVSMRVHVRSQVSSKERADGKEVKGSLSSVRDRVETRDWVLRGPVRHAGCTKWGSIGSSESDAQASTPG